MNSEMLKKRKAQSLTLITEDLNIISPSDVVQNKEGSSLIYIVDEDGLERVALGSSMRPFVGDHKIDKYVKCKNGPNGWVEFHNSENKKQRIDGNVMLYLSVNFEAGTKPPKVKTYISDLNDGDDDV